jgi:hypothetical protein
MKILTLIALILISAKSFALEELIIIQTVSKSKMSFIVKKGLEDGITEGQTSLFSTDSISLTARAVKANRHFSQWVISQKETLVPFKKDQFVSFSNSIEKVWTEVPYLQLQKIQNQEEEKKLKGAHKNLAVRLHLNQALDESVSGVESSETPDRSGYGLEVMYSKMLGEQLEWGFGGRYDQEISSKSEPLNLDIPTTRLLGLVDLTYHFDSMYSSRNHIYVGIGTGYGTSSTDVSGEIKSGSATILPMARIGYLTSPERSNYDLMIEASFESIAASESFSDGEEQTTNTSNLKLAIGVKF